LPFHPEICDALDGVGSVGILFEIGEDHLFDGFSFSEYQSDLPLHLKQFACQGNANKKAFAGEGF
jgi:hypothetical protein